MDTPIVYKFTGVCHAQVIASCPSYSVASDLARVLGKAYPADRYEVGGLAETRARGIILDSTPLQIAQ